MTIEIIESYDDKDKIMEALSSLGITLIPLDKFEWEQRSKKPWNLIGEDYPARSSNENIITINQVSVDNPYTGKIIPLCGIARTDLVKFKKKDNLNYKIVYFNNNNVTFYFS